MGLKSEILGLVFGVLLVLLTFGDSHLVGYVGNLDTIFGVAFYKPLDVLYALASVLVFLFYGKVKGGLKFNALAVAALASFLAVLALVSIDDITKVLGFSSLATYFSGDASRSYWLVMLWVYPIISYFAFLLFGAANQERRSAMQRRALSQGHAENKEF